MNMNRAAFQILLAKARYPSVRPFVERNVRTRRGHRRQSESRRIGAEPRDDLQRIDHIPLRLRHLLPVRIAHQHVDVHMAERHSVIFGRAITAGGFHRGILLVALHEVAAEHDHAGQPEEQNIESGDHQRVGIENFQIACLFRPTQCREWQQSRREPCVQHVGNLFQLPASALSALSGRLARDDHLFAVTTSPRPEFGVPTTAGARCTSRGCYSSSSDKSSGNFPGRS